MLKKNIAKAMAAATVLTTAAPMANVVFADVISNTQTEEVKALKNKVYELLNTKYTDNHNLLINEGEVTAKNLAGSKVYSKIDVELGKNKLDPNGFTNYAAFEKAFDKAYSELKNGSVIKLSYESKYVVRELEDGQLVNTVNATYDTDVTVGKVEENTNASAIMAYLDAPVVTGEKDDDSKYAKIPVSDGYITVVKGDDKLELNKPKFKVIDGYYVDANENSIKKFESESECDPQVVKELIALGAVVEGYYPVVEQNDKLTISQGTIAIVKQEEAAIKEELNVSDLYEAAADRLTVKGNELRKLFESILDDEKLSKNEDNLKVTIKAFNKAGEVEHDLDLVELVRDNTTNNKLSELNITIPESVQSIKLIVETTKDETVENAEWTPAYEATITEARNEDFNNIVRAFAGQTEILMRAGMDRYETSVEVSKKDFNTLQPAADSKKHVVLVSGANSKLVDGLAATPLAAELNAPVLITSADEIPKVVMDEIERLNPDKITIVGGTSGVSEAIETKLQKTYGFEVERLSGDDRYETSVAVANKMAALNRKTANGNSITAEDKFNQVFVVGGNGEADALSISAVAGIKGAPILLTPANKLDLDVKTFIQKYVNDNNNDADVYVVGGTNSVSSDVQNSLVDVSVFSNNNKIEVKRLAGEGRQETNAAVIAEFAKDDANNKQEGLQNWKFVIANSSNASMVDALSAGAAAAKTGSHIVLADTELTESQEDALKSVRSSAWKSRQVGYKVSTSVAKFVGDLVKRP